MMAIRCFLRSMTMKRGFTSVELVIVIVVLSLLMASIVIKNPFTADYFSYIAADQLIADIQYVQMKAMGLGSTQYITFNPGTSSSAREYSIQDEPEVRKLPADKNNIIIINKTNFGNTLYFNSLGEPCLSYSSGTCSSSCDSANGCTIALGKGSDSYRTIKIYPITGKVE